MLFEIKTLSILNSLKSLRGAQLLTSFIRHAMRYGTYSVDFYMNSMV